MKKTENSWHSRKSRNPSFKHLGIWYNSSTLSLLYLKNALKHHQLFLDLIHSAHRGTTLLLTGSIECTQNKISWTHPTVKVLYSYTGLLRKQLQSRESLLLAAGPYMSPVRVHPFWSHWEHRCNQFACALWARHTPSSGAQPPVLSLN